ncbi:hypothetical protein SCLCIDRAFT_1220174 [Scleroderma citrinum Foug A]|uniref:Uncharacterized protein n=1 Tax=Scleroderma citrinum Foug A TaxID=1036808 RepID=A0A0C2ZW79_9AGAM|nr:hypothetical protein SCLCIDRAFT_1220174 [Scleroderma citrinum Foug A]
MSELESESFATEFIPNCILSSSRVVTRVQTVPKGCYPPDIYIMCSIRVLRTSILSVLVGASSIVTTSAP